MGAKEGVFAACDINEVVTAAVGGTVGYGIAPDALTHPHQEATNACLRQHLLRLGPANNSCIRVFVLVCQSPQMPDIYHASCMQIQLTFLVAFSTQGCSSRV